MYRSEIINTLKKCVKFVINKNCTDMHGQQNIKFYYFSLTMQPGELHNWPIQVSRASTIGKLDSDRHLAFLLFQLCDVVLKIGVDSIHAHRVVLASVSPYFYAMFNGK